MNGETIQTIDAGEFSRLVRAGAVRRGDLVLFTRIRPFEEWLIRRVQARMLADYMGELPREVMAEVAPNIDQTAEYVHAACVLDELHLGEMTSPRATIALWTDRFRRGGRILVRRPRASLGWTPMQIALALERTADGFVADVTARRRYPLRELLIHYLWSWGVRKLVLHHRFRAIFASRSSDVCSGRYWHHAAAAGFFTNTQGTADHRPEAWYPARLAMSMRFDTVLEAEIGNPRSEVGGLRSDEDRQQSAAIGSNRQQSKGIGR